MCYKLETAMCMCVANRRQQCVCVLQTGDSSVYVCCKQETAVCVCAVNWRQQCVCVM